MPEKPLGKPRKRTAKAEALSSASPRGTPSDLQQYIADRLKALYDEAVAQPIPDRLLRLLDRLDSDPKK